MAYQQKILSDDEKAAQELEGRSRPNTSGVLDGYTGMSAPQGSVTPSTAKTPGSGFVNLDQYLKQNENEGGRMVGDTTKGLVGEVDAFGGKAGKVVSGSANDFTSAGGGKTATSVIKGLGKDASGTLDTASDFMLADYGGPSADDLAAGVRDDGKKLNEQLALVGDQDSQTAALNETYGTGKNGLYSTGFGMLDQFLVNGTDSGRNKTKEVVGKTAGVTKNVDSTAASLADAEKKARDELAANKKKVVGAAKTNLDNFVAGGAKKVGNLNAELDNLDNDGEVKADFGDVFSEDDYADLDALAQLSGAGVDDAWRAKNGYSTGTEKPKPELVFDSGEVGGAGSEAINSLPKILKVPTGPSPMNPWDFNPGTFGDNAADWAGNAGTIAKENPIYKEAVKGPPAPPPPPLPSFVEDVTGPAPEPVSEAKKLYNKYCLAAGTMIEMADGSSKAIQYVNVGDETLFGGLVTMIESVLSDDVFIHNGVFVASGHAVFDQGEWKRVGDGLAVIGVSANYVVYPMNTEKHVIVANDTIFADFQEVDGVEGYDECLAALNSEENIDWTMEIQDFLTGRSKLKRA